MPIGRPAERRLSDVMSGSIYLCVIFAESALAVTAGNDAAIEQIDKIFFCRASDDTLGGAPAAFDVRLSELPYFSPAQSSPCKFIVLIFLI